MPNLFLKELLNTKTLVILYIFFFAGYMLVLSGGVFADGGNEEVFNFPVGEKLTYCVRWMGIPVGQAVLNIKGVTELNGRQVYHITSETGTNAFFSKIYRVEDTVQTFVDCQYLYPWRFEKKLHEGHYQCDESMEYDQVDHHAVYRRKDKEDVVKEMEIPPETQDALSCLYYFRTRPLKVGEPVYIQVNADEKNWKMKVEVLKKETKEVRHIGVFDTFKIEPKVEFQGVFVRRGSLSIWLTTDSRRIPVFMETHVPRIGKVVAVLEQIENISAAEKVKEAGQKEKQKSRRARKE